MYGTSWWVEKTVQENSKRFMETIGECLKESDDIVFEAENKRIFVI